MKRTKGLFVSMVLSMPFATIALAQDPEPTQRVLEMTPRVVDVSDWTCEYCPFQKGFSGDVELGFGNVSEDSFKFGEYNGLNEKGGYFVGNLNGRYQNTNANYLDISGRNLGLDTRSLGIEGGRQGTYSLFLQYDELPHNISNSAVTPYRGVGTESLTLPPGWVDGGTTGGMTSLAASLQEVDLETKRKRLGVGISFIPASHWETKLSVRHETKEGVKRTAGSFGYGKSAQLLEPVDYVTDEVNVSLGYAQHKLQASLAYVGSTFSNSNDALRWENAFTAVAPAPDTGQLALPPDNQFHQIRASVGYQFTERTRASGDVAIGRMTQDEPFLPTTVNSALVVAAPPRTSADAEVNTMNANARLISAITNKLRVNAAYSYSDRDNQTPQAAYDWVTADDSVNPPRTNLPYSFTQSEFKVSAEYRLPKSTRLDIGYDQDTHERTFQEVDKTTEDTVWGKVRIRAGNNTEAILKLAHAERDAASYAPVAEIDPPQNPLLAKYNMADRTRDSAGFSASTIYLERVTFSAGIDYARDDYTKSILGLTESEETDVNLDASWMLTENADMHAFVSQQWIESTQVGSQAFSTPDWFATNKDAVNSVGLGYSHRLMENKLDVGVDYVLSQSRGEIAVQNGSLYPAFPDLKTRLNSLKLHAGYRLSDAVSLRLAYWYESYEADDWAVDGVTPSTIDQVLTLGETSPSYDVNVVSLALRYKF